MGRSDSAVPRAGRGRGAGACGARPLRRDQSGSPLEKVGGHDRRWALGLEAFRASRQARITESPDDLEVAGVTIPSKASEDRVMRIRYLPPDAADCRLYSVAELRRDPKLAGHFAGKVVFAGVTAQTAQRDRWITPYGADIGVEINANVYETIAQRLFLTDVADSAGGAVVRESGGGAGLIFASREWKSELRTGGGAAAGGARGSVRCLHAAARFSRICRACSARGWRWRRRRHGASWLHGRRMVRAEAAEIALSAGVQFVTHEMRTPLTAIQGSSELITRYAMPDEKRKQMAGMINTESKRLARMIETFLKRGAAFGRADGIEARAVRSVGNWWSNAWRGCGRWRSAKISRSPWTRCPRRN